MVEEDASPCAYGIEITSIPEKCSGVVYGARDARHFQGWVPLSDHAVLACKRPPYNDVGCYCYSVINLQCEMGIIKVRHLEFLD